MAPGGIRSQPVPSALGGRSWGWASTARRWRVLALVGALVLAGTLLGPLSSSQRSPRRAAPPAETAGAGLDLARLARLAQPGAVSISALDSYSGDILSATGIVLDRAGEVLTNNHVVEGATSITVQVGGAGQQVAATVVGVDPAADIAVLRLAGAPALTPLAGMSAGGLRLGTPIVVVGNDGPGPLGAKSGSVVALGQELAATDPVTEAPEDLQGLIEMAVPVEPGDSGGPVLDREGQVVGMTTAGEVIADGLVPADAAYAIPIPTALAVAREIEDGIGGPGILIGPAAFLGVQVVTYSPAVQAGPPPVVSFLSDERILAAAGALVVGVVAGSPAAAVGLRCGDVIVALGPHPVTSVPSLEAALGRTRPGTFVALRWVDPAAGIVVATVELAAGPVS